MSYADNPYHRGIAVLRRAGRGRVQRDDHPDLPAGEADEYLMAVVAACLAATLMVTPATPRAQMRAIVRRSRGFLYVMSVMATTGSTMSRTTSAGGRWPPERCGPGTGRQHRLLGTLAAPAPGAAPGGGRGE